jgi:DNA transformation protein and related proteins
MAVNEGFLEYVQDQLSESGEVETKKMFGGVGFFQEGLMFGMIGYGAFRLKVDATNQADYEARGMEPFYSGTKKKGMPYWEVPVEVLEDKKELASWVSKSVAIAQKSASKRKK